MLLGSVTVALGPDSSTCSGSERASWELDFPLAPSSLRSLLRPPWQLQTLGKACVGSLAHGPLEIRVYYCCRLMEVVAVCVIMLKAWGLNSAGLYKSLTEFLSPPAPWFKASQGLGTASMKGDAQDKAVLHFIENTLFLQLTK